MVKLALLNVLVSAAVLVSARPSKRASCTVDSTDSANDVADCASVTINAFTVKDGEVITMKPADGAKITVAGTITFAKTSSEGPLFTIDGADVTFDGAGNTAFDGNGAEYWDGEGTNGGVTKPHPLLKFKGSGTYSDFTVLNSPAQAVSIGNSDGLTFDGITIDNSAGDEDELGHNTDGFDVSAEDVTIQNSVVKNQDDCIAINSGKNIIFQNNQCSGGHGISVGSISADKTVDTVTITGNTVSNSMYGTRIKVKASATSASVSNVNYSGNTITGIDKYGVLISQSYPDDAGTPGTGAPISNVNFKGDTTSVTVNDGGKRLTVDCGACSGDWDFSALKITGGEEGTIDSDDAKITGGSY
ncbi:glycoside hydrolase family 28 protein [Schizophyllum amplum]|uniref:endo-polygalacturonase n=1 Tax=Schizophyllum amplum TaxID=97359 RepID=A0A550C7A7_9AGAR|nr:glycoside hydrolase family 28 protein [Auriculariopsis ampla]TRM60674.1 glycoside hydrolase family 28 protein [Auriculariopsis ampla]